MRRARAISPLARLAALATPALVCSGCSDLQIGSPESLWLLWLLPALGAFYVYVFRAKGRLLRRFASAPMLARLTGGVSRPRQVFKALLVLLGTLATVLALAELKYGFAWEEVRRQGVDIVVALDVSDSMLVEDAESGGRLSRLKRAKREIADLLSLLEGDRIGLVAFAGTAFVECPLTLDYAAAAIFLDTLDTDLIPVKGTDLGAAIQVSLEAFEGATHQSKAVILITDGEDHGGAALARAEDAKAAGVRLFTIGIGRDEGAPIPAPGGGFRRDRQGEIVLSRLDEPTLQKLALETGGSYVRSVTGDVDLEKIYSQGIKAVLEDQELGSRRRQRWEDRFQWALGLALVALMLEPLVSERRRGSAAGRARLLALVTLALAAPGAAQTGPPAAGGAAPAVAAPETAAAASAAPARRYADPYEAYGAGSYDQALEGFVDRQVERPEDPVLALNVGAAHFKMGNYAEADRALARAALAGDPALRAEALYALGNSAYRQGRLEEAVERYKASLELAPDDEDAKFNLEFVRDEIRRRHEEAQKRQQQGESGEQGEKGDSRPQEGDPQGEPSQEQQEQQSPGDEGERQPGEDDAAGPDQDGDGLPDAIERGGENPTDPANPDSDGDGLADGQEDVNRNGRVDPGETDPNAADSDGDGVPDAQEASATAGQTPQEQLAGLTPEEAERYLQALQEGRPEQHRTARGRVTRPLKDW